MKLLIHCGLFKKEICHTKNYMAGSNLSSRNLFNKLSSLSGVRWVGWVGWSHPLCRHSQLQVVLGSASRLFCMSPENKELLCSLGPTSEIAHLSLVRCSEGDTTSLFCQPPSTQWKKMTILQKGSPGKRLPD